jgi:hypothetical protein
MNAAVGLVMALAVWLVGHFLEDETSRFISISMAAKFDRLGLFAFV